jgi:hypothetical protein
VNAPVPCDLCGRSVRRRTKHHLIPVTRHSNKKNRRDFDRLEVKRRVLWLCSPCHRQVHAVLSEKELEREYNMRGQLAAQPEIAKFVAWIRNKPDGTTVPVRKARKNRRDQKRLAASPELSRPWPRARSSMARSA